MGVICIRRGDASVQAVPRQEWSRHGWKFLNGIAQRNIENCETREGQLIFWDQQATEQTECARSTAVVLWKHGLSGNCSYTTRFGSPGARPCELNTPSDPCAVRPDR